MHFQGKKAKNKFVNHNLPIVKKFSKGLLQDVHHNLCLSSLIPLHCNSPHLWQLQEAVSSVRLPDPDNQLHKYLPSEEAPW